LQFWPANDTKPSWAVGLSRRWAATSS